MGHFCEMLPKVGPGHSQRNIPLARVLVVQQSDIQTGEKPLIYLFREGSQFVQDNLACKLVACLVSTFREEAQAAQSIVALIAQ